MHLVFARLFVKLDRLSARGADSLLNKPASQAVHVEDMRTAELLTLLDIAQADAALQHVSLLFIRLHVFQLLELVDKLAPLIESQRVLTQSGQVVNHLTEEINRKRTSTHNHVEHVHVKKEVAAIKQQSNQVEGELLLKPLLPVIQLKE